MSGWTRLGVVISVLWACAVVGFSYYEYYHFPLEPFTTYLQRPDYSEYERAKKFHLIYIKETPGIEALSSNEREYFEKVIREAKTEEDRKGTIAARDIIYYSASVKWGSLIVGIIVPIVLGWLLCILAVNTTKWVAGGFKEKR